MPGTSSSQLRSWWADYRCHPSRMVDVALPAPDNGIELILVAKPSARIWAAFSQIMATESYEFRESAGGTYNCRPIADGSGRYSLHAYGIALDLNPHSNPQKSPLTYDYPASFIKRVEGITVGGKQAIAWGGRWTGVTPDAMHWQINQSPVTCQGVLKWDTGEELPVATWKSADGYTYTDVDDWGQFSEAIKWNINQGLMKGRRDETAKTGVFDPNTALDRDEAASLFYRIAKDSPTFKREIED